MRVTHLESKVCKMNNQINLFLNRTSFSDSSSNAAQPSPAPAPSPSAPKDVTDEQEMLLHISDIKDETARLKAACFFLFSKEELRNCSRTGKKSAKCINDPRPALDQLKLNRSSLANLG